MNNVPDSLLAGKELPTFKFALEKSKGRVIGKSTAKEATVEQLPISKGIAATRLAETLATSVSRRALGVRNTLPNGCAPIRAYRLDGLVRSRCLGHPRKTLETLFS